MREQWKTIPGFELYQASTRGRIRRSVGGKGAVKDRVLRPCTNHKGYLQVVVYHGELLPGQRRRAHRTIVLHRLIARAFLGEPGSLQVNHKTGIKTDNRISNLEYVTAAQNRAHAVAAGLMRPACGEAAGGSRLTESVVRKIRKRLDGIEYGGQAAIAREFGVSPSTITSIKKRKTWRHI